MLTMSTDKKYNLNLRIMFWLPVEQNQNSKTGITTCLDSSGAQQTLKETGEGIQISEFSKKSRQLEHQKIAVI